MGLKGFSLLGYFGHVEVMSATPICAKRRSTKGRFHTETHSLGMLFAKMLFRGEGGRHDDFQGWGCVQLDVRKIMTGPSIGLPLKNPMASNQDLGLPGIFRYRLWDVCDWVCIGTVRPQHLVIRGKLVSEFPLRT